LAGVNLPDVIKRLADPQTEEKDRWVLRLALLELANVEPTTEALASLAGVAPERAMGAMAVLQTEGLVSFETQD
jgi:hypothetical protein